MRIKISKKYIDNNLISFISMTNNNDFEVVFCNFGASIYSIYMKNRFGNKENVRLKIQNKFKIPLADCLLYIDIA